MYTQSPTLMALYNMLDNREISTVDYYAMVSACNGNPARDYSKDMW